MDYLLLIPTGLGLLPLIAILLLLNRRTYQVCPSCGLARKQLKPMRGPKSPDADVVFLVAAN